MTPRSQLHIRRGYGRLNPLGVAVFLVSLFILVAFWTTHKGAWALCLDGKPLVLVGEANDVARAVDRIEAAHGPLTAEQRARIKVVRVSGRQTLEHASPAQLADRLVADLGFVGPGVGLNIDGEVKMVFESRSEADAFLEELKAAYAVEDADSECRFAEKVVLTAVEAPRKQMVDRTGAWRVYKSRTKDDIEYRIKEGDTLWDVAMAHHMSVEQLLRANPGLTEDTVLALGSPLTISKQDPLLTVVARAQITETREIPYPVTVKRDTSLPMGSRKVVEPGKPGREEVTYAVTYRNGRLVERVRLASNQIEAPVARVEAQGATLVVASRAGGQLAWPAARGSISSRFGMRGGRMHNGLDIAAAQGTPIYAAESGRVCFTGWNGGYGRMVDIDHGGGVRTRYAHLSSAAVSAGRYVERGQVIGYMGSTGNSTGSHLHFEVIVNGRPLNPLNYL